MYPGALGAWLRPALGARMRASVALATITVFAAVSVLASRCASSSAAPLPISVPAPKTGEVTFYLSLPASTAGLDQAAAKVSDWAAANDRALIVELLVPASPADLTALGGAAGSYDATLRPEHTVQVIEYLQDHGVTPALWEVEGLDRPDDAVAIAAAAKRGGRTADCIVLGRHDNHDHHLDHWLQVAAPVPGFTGFAIGRGKLVGPIARPSASPQHRRRDPAQDRQHLFELRSLLPRRPRRHAPGAGRARSLVTAPDVNLGQVQAPELVLTEGPS
jgi:hypothetical protein